MRSLVLGVLAALAIPSFVRAAPLPPTPAPAEILEATPFVLEHPIASPRGGTFTRGHVLVVRADPAVTELRQAAMPVLQCDDRIALHASRGGDGVLVGVVPGDLELGAALLFFGEPTLPESLTPGDALRRAASARDAGIASVGADAAARALARGPGPLKVARFADLAPFLLALRCRLEPEALAEAGTPCGSPP